MKKFLIVILVLIFAFASVRIITSTYENAKQKNNAKAMNVHISTIVQNF